VRFNIDIGISRPLTQAIIRSVLTQYVGCRTDDLDERFPGVTVHVEEMTPDFIRDLTEGREVDPEDPPRGAILFEGEDSREVRDWTIVVFPDDHATTITLALIHEVIHLGQYLTGRLRTLRTAGGEVTIWDGKQVPSDVPYYDLPEEVEAYDRLTEMAISVAADPRILQILEAGLRVAAA